MHSNSITFNNDIKSIFNIHDKSIVLDNYEIIDDSIIIHLSRNRQLVKCSVCGELTDKVHDYYIRTINHGVFNNRKCFIKYKQRRYRCDCGKRFSLPNQFVEKYNKISSNSKWSIINEAILVSSFKDMGKRLNMSSTTVRRIFNMHCKQSRKSLPRVLSIDEFKGNSGGYKYNLSICDPSNRQIIDILPCRYKDYLHHYFSTFSSEELSNVEVITMDMYHTYHDICKEFFPNATIVIDTFHFVRLVTNAANNVRIRIMKKFNRIDKQYKVLKSRWRLFNTKPDCISDKWIFDKRSKQWTSDSSLLDYMRNIHPELGKTRELLESFYEIVHNSSYPTVYHELNNWIIEAKKTNIGEVREAALSIERWLPEIVNSFMINPDTETKYTSAFIEGSNNYIKVIKRTSYGFRCFNTFRNKILYHHNNSRHIISA
ncbi:ISL3 family transposase [Mycoplasmatota bacterium]|nr:ISL3 family transposase [Mycoplasmatota bacterium]QVK20668.1 ISL3 family transposase [Mycoplasmatota bacterium]QVK21032.1 ISL3 family transposase [Mycoplasmatota bacterium]